MPTEYIVDTMLHLSLSRVRAKDSGQIEQAFIKSKLNSEVQSIIALET